MARKNSLKDLGENPLLPLGPDKELVEKQIVLPGDNGKDLPKSNLVVPAERAVRSLNLRARSISAFCKRWDIGRTTVYAEIKDKRLKAHKVRGRTIITIEAEEEWSRALPEAGAQTST